ncbi:MAG: hypothetical protein VXZ36_14695 [Pseudomonadota bacterium]|nr:hypothetical protein [Pseudomonadota bacterium]MEC8376919.1 hypothetical protein [Pseudomonadota bacterium]MEC8419056.1 hypothetical protein [Pseudomonadota bacterium]
MEITNGIRTLYLSGKNQGRRFVSKKSVGVVRFWRSLNFAQRCYFSATCLFALWLYFDINSVAFELLMFSFVLVGVFKETWPKFMLVWNSLPGKAAILFVYAVIANFALASASGMVNDVTGVSASALPYSHNFALILMLPSWFFLTSTLLLFSAIILTPLYLLVLLLLKPIGIKRVWHPPEYRFVFTTAFVRYILTWGVFLKLIVIALQLGIVEPVADSDEGEVVTIDYAAGKLATEILRSEEGEVAALNKQASTAPVLEREPNNSSQQNAITKAQALANVTDTSKQDEVRQTIKQINADANELNNELDDVLRDAAEKSKSFRRMQRVALAHFIFEYEADARSRCAHTESSRVIELNDYEILQVTQNKDETNEIGFDYQVLACKSAAIGLGENK